MFSQHQVVRRAGEQRHKFIQKKFTGRSIFIEKNLLVCVWSFDTYVNFPRWTCNLYKSCYTDKKENQFFSNIRKFRVEQLQSLYEEGLPDIWGNAQIFHPIWGGRYLYTTLQLLHYEFPYIWGKFDFLFYECNIIIENGTSCVSVDWPELQEGAICVPRVGSGEYPHPTAAPLVLLLTSRERTSFNVVFIPSFQFWRGTIEDQRSKIKEREIAHPSEILQFRGVCIIVYKRCHEGWIAYRLGRGLTASDLTLLLYISTRISGIKTWPLAIPSLSSYSDKIS